MGQFFYNKYLVSYGFGLALASFDGIPTPGLPKCVGRIHLYSDMWKYFDQGLYEFLFVYVINSQIAFNKVSKTEFSFQIYLQEHLLPHLVRHTQNVRQFRYIRIHLFVARSPD